MGRASVVQTADFGWEGVATKRGVLWKVYEGQSWQRRPEAWKLEFFGVTAYPFGTGDLLSVFRSGKSLSSIKRPYLTQKSLELGSPPGIIYFSFSLLIFL